MECPFVYCTLLRKRSQCVGSRKGNTEYQTNHMKQDGVCLTHERLRGGNDPKDVVKSSEIKPGGEAPQNITQNSAVPKDGPSVDVDGEAKPSLNQGSEQTDAVKTLFKKIQEDRNVQQQIMQVIGQVVPLLFGDQLQHLINPPSAAQQRPWFEEMSSRLFKSRNTPTPPSFRPPLLNQSTPFQLPMPHMQRPQHPMVPMHPNLIPRQPQHPHPVQGRAFQGMNNFQSQFHTSLYEPEQPLVMQYPPTYQPHYEKHLNRNLHNFYSTAPINQRSQSVSATNCSQKRTFVITNKDSKLSRRKPGRAILTFKRQSLSPQQYSALTSQDAANDLYQAAPHRNVQYQLITSPAGTTESYQGMPKSPVNVRKVYLRSSGRPTNTSSEVYRTPMNSFYPNIAQRPRDLFSSRIVSGHEIPVLRKERNIRYIEKPQNLHYSNTNNRIVFQGSGEQFCDWPTPYSDIRHAQSSQSVNRVNGIPFPPQRTFYSGIRLGGGGPPVLKCRRLAGSGGGPFQGVPSFQNTQVPQRMSFKYDQDYPVFPEDSFEPVAQMKRMEASIEPTPETIMKRISENISRESLLPIPPPIGFHNQFSHHAQEKDFTSESDQSIETNKSSSSAIREEIRSLIQKVQAKRGVVVSPEVSKRVPVKKHSSKGQTRTPPRPNTASYQHRNKSPSTYTRPVKAVNDISDVSDSDGDFQEEMWNGYNDTLPGKKLQRPQSPPSVVHEHNYNNERKGGAYSGKKSQFYHPENVQIHPEYLINDYVEHPKERIKRVHFAEDKNPKRNVPQHNLSHPTDVTSDYWSDTQGKIENHIKIQEPSSLPSPPPPPPPPPTWHHQQQASLRNDQQLKLGTGYDNYEHTSPVTKKLPNPNNVSKRDSVIRNINSQSNAPLKAQPSLQSRKGDSLDMQDSLILGDKTSQTRSILQHMKRDVKENTNNMQTTSIETNSQPLTEKVLSKDIFRAFNNTDYSPDTNRIIAYQNHVLSEYPNPYDQLIFERYGGYTYPNITRPNNQKLGLIFDSPSQRSVIKSSMHTNTPPLSKMQLTKPDFTNNDWVSEVEVQTNTVDLDDSHLSMTSAETQTTIKSSESGSIPREIYTNTPDATQTTDNSRKMGNTERRADIKVPVDTQVRNNVVKDKGRLQVHGAQRVQKSNQNVDYEQTYDNQRLNDYGGHSQTNMNDTLETFENHPRSDERKTPVTGKQRTFKAQPSKTQQQCEFWDEQQNTYNPREPERHNSNVSENQRRQERRSPIRNKLPDNNQATQKNQGSKDIDDQKVYDNRTIYAKQPNYDTTKQGAIDRRRKNNIQSTKDNENYFGVEDTYDSKVNGNQNKCDTEEEFSSREYVQNISNDENMSDSENLNECVKQRGYANTSQQTTANRKKYYSEEAMSVHDTRDIENEYDSKETHDTRKAYNNQSGDTMEEYDSRQVTHNEATLNIKRSERNMALDNHEHDENRKENKKTCAVLRRESTPELDLPLWTRAYLIHGNLSSTDEQVSATKMKGDSRVPKWAADVDVGSVESGQSDASTIDTIDYLKAKTFDEEGLPRYSDIEEYFNHSGAETELEESLTAFETKQKRSKSTKREKQNVKGAKKQESTLRIFKSKVFSKDNKPKLNIKDILEGKDNEDKLSTNGKEISRAKYKTTFKQSKERLKDKDNKLKDKDNKLKEKGSKRKKSNIDYSVLEYLESSSPLWTKTLIKKKTDSKVKANRK